MAYGINALVPGRNICGRQPRFLLQALLPLPSIAGDVFTILYGRARNPFTPVRIDSYEEEVVRRMNRRLNMLLLAAALSGPLAFG
jgi:hypothetical protein